MAIGRVKWFNDTKGYGFIEKTSHSLSILTPEETDALMEEIFVHYSAIQSQGRKTLEQGQEVEFDIYEGPKGKTAQNVTVV